MTPRPAMPLLAFFQVVAGAAVFAYALLLAYAWLASDRLIFRPPPPTYPDGPQILKIPTPDGVALAARHLPQAGARFTVLYFHGNAEDLGSVEPFLAELRDRLGVSVLAWDYRGYGRSGSRPAEPSTLRDARTVAAYAAEHLGVPPERIILYGWSLGGGPAVALAAGRRYAGLILQSSFTSAFRVMTRVRLLPFDKFDNLAKIGRISCPLLVIHGTADRVIPFSHGKSLYAAAAGPKSHLRVEGAGHNDLIETAGDAYWQALDGFVRGL